MTHSSDGPSMKALLGILRTSRDAKRNAVLGRLNAAQRELAAGHAAIQVAQQALAQAMASRAGLCAVVTGNAGALGWGQALSASNDAMVERCQKAVMQANSQIPALEKACADQQAALVECERALMRTDELEQLEKARAAEADALQQQQQDDDLAAGYRTQPRVYRLARPECP